MKSKAIGKIFFWCVVFGVHFFLCYKIISSYREYRKMLEGLDTPVEMSEAFMDSEYDVWWDDIDKVMLGRTDPRFSLVYEIGADIVPDMDITRYRKYDNRELSNSVYGREWVGHTYEIGTDFPIYSFMEREEVVNNAVRTVEISISLNGSSNIITGVTDQDRDTGEIDYYGINLIEENGEYVVGGGNTKEEFEEHTGITLEEIVEMAEKNRQGFEDIMYGMKAHEIKRNKLFCIGKLAVLHILLIAFVLYMNWDAVKRGIKRLRKEGKQDGKDSLKE